MNDIISKMRSELRLVLKESVADYPDKPREKWLFDWPSQMILVVNQIFWCQEVEQVMMVADVRMLIVSVLSGSTGNLVSDGQLLLLAGGACCLDAKVQFVHLYLSHKQ